MRTVTAASVPPRFIRLPRVFVPLAPLWAIYALVVLALALVTGIAGWMAQRGILLIWGILVALGLSAQIGALGVVWQRHAWRKQVRQTPLPAIFDQRIARTNRRLGGLIGGMACLGLLAVCAGILGAIRTSGKPTMR